ncbi:type VII secretion protein EsaA [Rummeliibacillus pycnus]|uniref:type VII secretion protein EsaA n=1 Tax=Rummeliibacillus pycnus TaxID=101070 RepID=UPI0037CB9CE6
MKLGQKYVFKVIILVLLIVALPILSFQFVNHKTDQKQKVSNTIAIVNEDIGAEKEGKSLALGNDLSTILNKNSKYEWKVVGRGAAQNGLKSNNYVAVLYIPSDFSTKLMQYEENNTVETKFNYSIQDKLTTLEKEKVQREVERATGVANDKISALYWSYVSQDLQDVRSGFDGIVKKEIDFQTKMTSFYKTVSSDLSNEMDGQTKQLKSIKSGIKNYAENTNDSITSADQFQAELKEFIQQVNQFQEYQNTHEKIMQQNSNEQMKIVESGMLNQQSDLESINGVLSDQQTLIEDELSGFSNNIDESNQVLENLYLLRSKNNNFEVVMDTLTKLETSNIENQLKDIINKRNNLPNSDSPGSGDSQETISSLPEIKLNIQNEEDALDSVATKIKQVQKSIEAANQDGLPELSKASQNLQNIQSNLVNIKTNLQAIQEEQSAFNSAAQQLLVTAKNLEKENADLQYKLDQIVDGNESKLVDQIKKIETKILKQSVLNDSQKTALSSAFYTQIAADDSIQLLNYYEALNKFDGTLSSSLLNDKKLEAFKKEVKPQLEISKEETDLYQLLLDDLPSIKENIDNVKPTLMDNLKETNNLVSTHFEQISTDLNNVTDLTQTLQSQITETIHPPSLGNLSDINSLEGTHDMIRTTMKSVKSSIESIDSTQTSVIGNAQQILSNVNGVKKDAGILDNKLESNLLVTKKYKEDIFAVLPNTFIDGQRNTKIFDYLAAPINVENKSPIVEEVKKVPPLVLIIIILVCSLLIGYLVNEIKYPSLLMKSGIFIMLNLIVGLIISMYSLKMYALDGTKGIQWSIFTILLLMTCSAFILNVNIIGRFIGWIGSISLLLFFIAPLLALTVPDFNYRDPMTAMYMSIQYDMNPPIELAYFILVCLIILFMSISLATIKFRKGEGEVVEE